MTETNSKPSSAFSLQPSAFNLLMSSLALVVILALGLGLRLLAWHWHEQVPLGGDEQEYFNQALTFLREHRYVELRFMRPPAYTAFLSLSMYLFDSLVQRLRLIQAIISTLTILPVYAFTYELSGKRSTALLAAILLALNYTLASTASELLTETLFVFGFSMLLWLLALSGRKASLLWPCLAGLTLGALILTRSVALPLLGLGILWLLQGDHSPFRKRKTLIFLLASMLIVLPWTARNYLTYNALILVDTTGAENLWLDNDPAGREAVKAQLYAFGEDRAQRQSLASQRGLSVILADPMRFVTKAWGEAQRFMALEHTDDMLARPAIWVPPAEVWLRLILGDGMWLLTMLAGVLGLWLYHPQSQQNRYAAPLLALWCLYIMSTSMLFHVELRYRLPVYPPLIAFAALLLSSSAHYPFPKHAPRLMTSWLLALISCILLLGLMLLHRNYPAAAQRLIPKHIALAQAERALTDGDAQRASLAAQQALRFDQRSVLARVALARAALLSGDTATALAILDAAIQTLPAHPYAHLLRGAMLRAQGNMQAAKADLAYEKASREDLQAWAWQVFAPIATEAQQLEIGSGLDLGFVNGFYLPEDGYRWTKERAQIQLYSSSETHILVLELASGRPAGLPDPALQVILNGQPVTTLELASQWQHYEVTLPKPTQGTALIELRSPTFNPRRYDRSSGDARELGVMLKRIALR